MDNAELIENLPDMQEFCQRLYAAKDEREIDTLIGEAACFLEIQTKAIKALQAEVEQQRAVERERLAERASWSRLCHNERTAREAAEAKAESYRAALEEARAFLGTARQAIPNRHAAQEVIAQALAAGEAQQAEVESYRAALEPFAEAANNMSGDEHDWGNLWESAEAMMLTYADLRRARQALTAGEAQQS